MAERKEFSEIPLPNGNIGVVSDDAARSEIDNLKSGATKAGAVDWKNVDGKPTNVSAFSNDANYQNADDVKDIVKNSSINVDNLSGVIGIDHIPQGALERVVTVADDTARLALTKNDIQKGDTVKVTSTGLMYLVKDDDRLNQEDGYEVYRAGSAASVPWSGVTGRPSKVSEFQNDANYIKDGDPRLADARKASDVFAWAKNETLSDAINGDLTTESADPTDEDYYIAQYAGGGTNTTTYHRKPHSSLWNYIKDKIASVLGLTKASYGGKASTAGTADSANSVAWDNVSGRPTKVSDLTNDEGYLTEHQSLADYVKTDDSRLSDARPASDVSSWAKAATKPSYTASEVGALPSTTKYAGSSSVGGDANRAVKIKDSTNDNDITITYGKAGQSKTSWLASWNGYELGAISPSNVAVGSASSAASANLLGDNIHQIPYYSYSSFGSDTDTQHFYQNLVKKLVTSHADLGGKTLIGQENPNSMSVVIFRAYDLANYNSTGYPRYSQGIAIELGGGMFKFGTNNGSWYWDTVDHNTTYSSLPANGGNSSTVNGHSVNSDVPANAKFTDTNTWRGITNSYSGTDTGTSLSQKGANDLYNALANGYANSAGSAAKLQDKYTISIDSTGHVVINY